MAFPVINPHFQFFDNVGEPLANGFVYTYESTSSTPKTTYEDADLDSENTNPIELNSAGRCSIYVDDGETFKYILKDADGVTLDTQDKVKSPIGTQAGIGAALYPPSAVEGAAGVIPAVKSYPYGDSRRYADLTDWAAVAGGHELSLVGSYTISAPLAFPSSQHIKITGDSKPLVTVSASGIRAFQCASPLSFHLDGVRFKGNGSATVPSSTFGGFAADSTGLVTVTNGTDVRITNCEAEDFYSGFSALNCERVWLENNYVTDWLLYGIVASRTNNLHIHNNVLEGCEQTGAVGAYGISATGDQAGGDTQRSASVCFNKISGIPSWDAIMTHDFDGLTIIGNDCRDVRNGLDIGFAISTNVVKNINLSDNYIEATTTDTWAGAGAVHNAILFTGFDATHRASDAVIGSNTCKNFFTMTGSPAFSGNAAVIAVVQSDRVKVANNIIVGAGAVGSPAGIFYSGTCDQPTVTANSLQGEFIAGGIRFASVIGTAAVISGNSVKQVDDVNDAAISITGSTITGLAMVGNATNSAIPFSQGTSTITYSGSDLLGSKTFDPASLSDGSADSTTVTVSGASLGDWAEASFSLDLQGITVTAYVSSVNTVTVRFQNESSGTLDIGSGTLRVRVRRQFA